MSAAGRSYRPSRAAQTAGRRRCQGASGSWLRACPFVVGLAVVLVSAAADGAPEGPPVARAAGEPVAFSLPPEAAKPLVPPAAIPLAAADPQSTATTTNAAPLTDWRLLAAMLAAFAVLAAVRFAGRRRDATLPPDVFEVLGIAPLAGPHSVRVVRFGPRTLLVAVSSAGCTTLGEITDAEATARIVAACRGGMPQRRRDRGPAAPTTGAASPAGSRAGRPLAAVVLAWLLCGVSSPVAGQTVADRFPAEPSSDVLSQPVERTSLERIDPLESAVEPRSVGGAAALLEPVDAANPAPLGSDPLAAPAPVHGGSAVAPADDPGGLASLLRRISPETLGAILPSALLFGVVSLAPAVLLMTTSFVRISVVLMLLRQGLGTAVVPSNQILSSLAIFLSALVMWPVWQDAWQRGVEPYRQGAIAADEAFAAGSLPIRRWMATQIETAGNRDTLLLFLARHPSGSRDVKTYDDVPVETLLPAFLVSELETAFTIGFRMLLPFLVLDLLVATLVVATGLVMLPPTLVSLPLKLVVFVAADGWTLVVRGLLEGIGVAAV